MQTKRAYKYRFYPTDKQAHNLACTFGCARFVYNWALNKKKRAYFDHGVNLKINDLSGAITVLKKEEGMAWLKEVSSVVLQQSLRHLDTAYKNFFEKRAGYPTFKKKHDAQAATYTNNAFTLKGESLTLAKQDTPLNIVWSRPLPQDAQPSSITVSRDKTGRYLISILIEEDIEPLPPVAQEIGLDVGLKSFVVMSTGESIANPKYYARDEKKLARAQRQHAKKKKGSKNREKTRKKVARIHARIADRRRDYQQQLSTRIIRENQTICVESLNVKGMVKNHNLAKSISDVGWGGFIRMLEYKARWYGRTFIKIDRFYPSSKTCSACGHILDTLMLDVREWTCSACGVCHDRDHNAACNILVAGLAMIACGGTVRPVDSKGLQAGSNEAGSSSR